jgi:hypothetical protein
MPVAFPPPQAIPLLFPCSAENFRSSADLIPLFRSVAELMRKRLIWHQILNEKSGFFTPHRLFLL